MSEQDFLTPCQCCKGITSLVPVLLHNRPGLPELVYRVGTHASFKATMLAQISRKAKVSALGWRTNEDFTIALLDAWAVTLDVLTFYQERILNEAYLRTAIERRSLLELARLIGYELRPGVAAGVLLAFLLDSSPGSPLEVTIAVGTAAQSIPSKEEVPQTFETSADLLAKPRWNELKPRLTFSQSFDSSTRTFYVKGTAANLKAGDPMLLVTGEGGETQTFLRVHSVTIQASMGRTLVTLDVNPPPPPGYLSPGKELVTLAPGSFGTVTSAVQTDIVGSTDIQTALDISGDSVDDLINRLAALRETPPEPPQPGDPGLYALRASAAPFGHNAPLYPTLPKEWRPEVFPDDWDEFGWPITQNTQSIDYGDGRTLFLDQEVKGIVEDDWVIINSRNEGAKVYQVESVSVESIADFGLTGKSSRLVLKQAPGETFDLDRIEDYQLREASIYTVSQFLELAELPIDTIDAGTDTLELESIVPDLQPGQILILTGERLGEYEGVPGAEEVELLNVGQGLFTTLYFTKPLVDGYKRDSVSIYANIAAATHGETKSEVVGSGDASRPFPEFVLRQPPLTYVSSALSPSGAVSTLALRVNGVLWNETPSFFELGPNDRAYALRLDDDGVTHVQFGDGLRGARVPTGSENIAATYRKGIGTAGLVDGGRISLLPRKPLGVRSVLNPLPSSGAQDPETRDLARVNAPLTVRTLDRVVSLTDFEDFARTFSGIGKARADWIWEGSRRIVHVTVGAPDGEDLSPEVLTNLIAAIDRARVPFQPVLVSPYEKLFFTLTAKLKIDPAYDEETVLAAAETALRDAFSFDVREFAERAATSDVLATLERVEGVLAVDLDTFTYELTSGGNAPDAFGLPALGARFDQATRQVLAAQLLVITPAPLDLRKMP